MGAIADLINKTFPTSVTDGNDMLTQFRANLDIEFTGEPLFQTFIDFLVKSADRFWNDGVSLGLTIEQNIQSTKALLIEFSTRTRTLDDFEQALEQIGEIGEAISDIIPDIPNPFAWIEWLQKNWLLIVIAIAIVMIIIIIVFATFVTQPLMDAVMIGALS